MRVLKNCIKRLILWLYNNRHSTKIYSIRASTKAKYGIGVLISEQTTVTDNVIIQDYSYVNRGSYVENCSIGKYCSISSGVYICPFEHDYQMKTTHPIIRWGEPIASRPRVVIGNDVLISLNAIILEGISIGNGAIIGAGAVVTKDVKPYEIVGGVPAKHIKYRFPAEEIERLQELKWWDWNMEMINKNVEFLRNKVENILYN